MAVSVNTTSAKISVTNNAVPKVHIGTNNVICHLSQGFSANKNPGDFSHAFDAEGSVKVVFGKATDNLNNWDFGFMQLAKVHEVAFFFAGRTSSEGGIAIKAHLHPALTHTVTLDSIATFSPWTKPAKRFSANLPEVKSKTGDHPSVKAGLSLANSKTNKRNFLFHIIDSREFWTVFRAEDPAGNVQNLAHFHWKLRYDVMFKWKNGKPVVKRSSSSFSIDSPVKGAPTENELQFLLTTPTGPLHNPLMQRAITQSIIGGQTANRKDLAKRFANVGHDFFQ